MKDQKLTYEMNFSEAEFINEADKKNFRINGVSLLGEISKNGYSYAVEAMRAAKGLYEGVQAFINHPNAEEQKLGRRDVRNLAGKFENARFDESAKKIKADFVGLPNDNGKLFVDIAENMPKIAGTSQNAAGRFARVAGKKIVESITKVFSVDLVANPATNNGIFENDNQNKEQVMEYSDITKDELQIRRKDLYEAIMQEGHAAGSKSRDDEVAKLTTEKDKAVQESDKLNVEKALAGKAATVEKMLAESKLPKEAQTEVFREQLMKCDPDDKGSIEEAAKALIDDRMKAVKPGGVRNMGGSHIKEGDGNDSLSESS